jgi:flagellar L-ring protein precursor FlgH
MLRFSDMNIKNINSRSFVIAVCLLGWLGSAQATSLYSDQAYVGLYSDPRAAKVGATLTVLIYEQASAATSADRATNESTGISGGIRGNQNLNAGEIDVATQSEGGGSLSRSGQLMASVSVTVREVLPNGELSVQGEQLIEFNEENQHIKIEGRVRPQDISAENTVISTRLADAKISYIGEGLLGQQQKPGWLTRAFNWIF